MASIFRMWADSFRGSETKLFLLEGDGETGLYKSQTWHNGQGDSPVYHVWIDGKCKCAILNYREAYEIFRKNFKPNRELNNESQKGE